MYMKFQAIDRISTAGIYNDIGEQSDRIKDITWVYIRNGRSISESEHLFSKILDGREKSCSGQPHPSVLEAT
jgi:hypothetical protein